MKTDRSSVDAGLRSKSVTPLIGGRLPKEGFRTAILRRDLAHISAYSTCNRDERSWVNPRASHRI
jgi:hypothetical protein